MSLLLTMFLGACGPLEPRQITPDGFTGFEPQIAASGPKVCVVCGRGDKLFALESANGGASFSPPVELPTQGHLALGMRRGPRVVFSGKTIVVSAVSGYKGGGADGDLLTWRSTDDGATWSKPVVVNDAVGAAREGLHAMCSASDGSIACAWLDLRVKGTAIWSSTSADGGATWSKNVQVYRSPDGHVCECCHPSVAFAPGGKLYVMFRNWLGGSRDMYLSTSDDRGRTFGSAEKLGLGTWPLNACPMDGGDLAVAPDGTVTTVWRRENKVFACNPGKPESKVAEGTQPWVCFTGTAWWTVFEQRGALRAGRLKEETQLIAPGRNSEIASLQGTPCAVWSDVDGRVYLKRLSG